MSPKTIIIVPALILVGTLTACVENQKSDVESGDISITKNDNQLFQEKNIDGFRLAGSKKIVLTYDDGPTPYVTDALLEVLRRHDVKATFFILGRAVRGQGDTLKSMKADGHILGNHTYSHANLATDKYATNISYLIHEIADADMRIRPYMNPAKPLLFRAPFGAWSPRHAAKLNSVNTLRDYVGPIYWDIGSEVTPAKRPLAMSEIKTAADWSCWTRDEKLRIPDLSVDVCAAGYFNEITAKGGGVVLMHDKDIRTVRLTQLLIPRLKAAGYEFINLDELQALRQLRTSPMSGL